jgi:hypothetical protein
MNKKYVIAVGLVCLFMFGCGIKKFPLIPFFKSPPTVKKVEYKIENGKVVLTWDNLKKSVKQYNIYVAKAPYGVEYCLTCDKNYRKIDSISPEEFGDKISVTIEGLENNFQYCYAVKAETSGGKEGKLSNKVCFDWFYDKNIIYNANAFPLDRSLKISWKKGSVKGIDYRGVNIYKKDKEGAYELMANEESKDFYIVKHLKNGKKYTFYIAPEYYFGKTLIEGCFIKIAGRPEDLTPPALPDFFTGYYTNGGIFLKWAKSISDDIFGYDLIRKEENGKRYVQVNSSIIKKENFFDSSVEKGKIYYYKIRCIDRNFNASEFSNPVKIIAE